MFYFPTTMLNCNLHFKFEISKIPISNLAVDCYKKPLCVCVWGGGGNYYKQIVKDLRKISQM